MGCLSLNFSGLVGSRSFILQKFGFRLVSVPLKYGSVGFPVRDQKPTHFKTIQEALKTGKILYKTPLFTRRSKKQKNVIQDASCIRDFTVYTFVISELEV